ncbi:MAG: imidazole glycerol phosphate synthase subunit HisF [Halobacteriovoraceae bacterium]|jgi:imidazole glycerol-phosphate synthase subunit HisF|nr:imidazole glycerol phosphate synthase subunit HisF [Halobacteriovoraceae bacterium]
MSDTVRVIARLDIKGPNLIKGIEFEGNRVLGVAEFFAKKYYEAGVDELIYQDSVASLYRRNGLIDIIKKTSKEVFVPLTVAGGIRSVDDMREILRAGADKVAINTAATENPLLIDKGAKEFGSQCIVSSIEAYNFEGKYQVWVDYGREVTKLDAVEWAKEVEDRGAGEILLTAIHREGTGEGFDLEMTEKIASMVKIPVIASGGAGKVSHVPEVVKDGCADAVAIASLFHYHYLQKVESHTMTFDEARLRMGEHIDSGNIEFLKGGYAGMEGLLVKPSSIEEVKSAMKEGNISVRPQVELGEKI